MNLNTSSNPSDNSEGAICVSSSSCLSDTLYAAGTQQTDAEQNNAKHANNVLQNETTENKKRHGFVCTARKQVKKKFKAFRTRIRTIVCGYGTRVMHPVDETEWMDSRSVYIYIPERKVICEHFLNSIDKSPSKPEFKDNIPLQNKLKRSDQTCIKDEYLLPKPNFQSIESVSTSDMPTEYIYPSSPLDYRGIKASKSVIVTSDESPTDKDGLVKGIHTCPTHDDSRTKQICENTQACSSNQTPVEGSSTHHHGVRHGGEIRRKDHHENSTTKVDDIHITDMTSVSRAVPRPNPRLSYENRRKEQQRYSYSDGKRRDSSKIFDFSEIERSISCSEMFSQRTILDEGWSDSEKDCQGKNKRTSQQHDVIDIATSTGKQKEDSQTDKMSTTHQRCVKSNNDEYGSSNEENVRYSRETGDNANNGPTCPISGETGHETCKQWLSENPDAALTVFKRMEEYDAGKREQGLNNFLAPNSKTENITFCDFPNSSRYHDITVNEGSTADSGNDKTDGTDTGCSQRDGAVGNSNDPNGYYNNSDKNCGDSSAWKRRLDNLPQINNERHSGQHTSQTSTESKSGEQAMDSDTDNNTTNDNMNGNTSSDAKSESGKHRSTNSSRDDDKSVNEGATADSMNDKTNETRTDSPLRNSKVHEAVENNDDPIEHNDKRDKSFGDSGVCLRRLDVGGGIDHNNRSTYATSSNRLNAENLRNENRFNGKDHSNNSGNLMKQQSNSERHCQSQTSRSAEQPVDSGKDNTTNDNMNSNTFSGAKSESGKDRNTNCSGDDDKSDNAGSTGHSRNDKTDETSDTGCDQKHSKYDGAGGNKDVLNDHDDKSDKRSGDSLVCKRRLDSGGGIDHNNRSTCATSGTGENADRLLQGEPFNGKGHSNSSDCIMKPKSNSQRRSGHHRPRKRAISKSGERPVDSGTDDNTPNDSMNNNTFSDAKSESGKDRNTNCSGDDDKSDNAGSTGHSRNDKTDGTSDTGCDQKHSKYDGAGGNHDVLNNHDDKSDKRSGDSLVCNRRLDSGGGIDYNNRSTYATSSTGENADRLRQGEPFNGKGHSNSSDCIMKPKSNSKRRSGHHRPRKRARSKSGEQPVDSGTDDNSSNDNNNGNTCSDPRPESEKDEIKNNSRDEKKAKKRSNGHSKIDKTYEKETESPQRHSQGHGAVGKTDDHCESSGGIDHKNRLTNHFNGKGHSNSSDCKMKLQSNIERRTEQHQARTCKSGEQPVNANTNNKTPDIKRNWNHSSREEFHLEESAWRGHSSNDDSQNTVHDPEPRRLDKGHVDAETGLKPIDIANTSEHERTQRESSSVGSQRPSVESRTNPDVRPKLQDFSNFNTRLKTFEHAPDLHARKDRLAEDGLYYVGPGASLKCFSCGVILDYHDSTMKMWELHAIRSPNCPHLHRVKGECRIRDAVRKCTNQETITTNTVQVNEVTAEHLATDNRHRQSDGICVSAVTPVLTQYNRGCLCISTSEKNFFNDPSSPIEDLLESIQSKPLSFEEMQRFLDFFPQLHGCKVFSNIDLPRPCPILTKCEMGVFVVFEDARSRGGSSNGLGHFIAVQINTIMSNEVHITIYDNLRRRNHETNHYTLKLISSLLNLRPDTILTVHIFPVQYQLLNWDCGPLVLNDVIHIRQGKEDGLRALFDQEKIRSHLLHCVQTHTCTRLAPIQSEHVSDETSVTHSYIVNRDGSVVTITVSANETI